MGELTRGTMQRGVWQCTSVMFRYCKRDGSSRGAREFLETAAPGFIEADPQLTFEAKLRPGKHPFVEAFYVNGRSKQIGLKNETAEYIEATVQSLRDQSGKKLIKRAQQLSRSLDSPLATSRLECTPVL